MADPAERLLVMVCPDCRMRKCVPFDSDIDYPEAELVEIICDDCETAGGFPCPVYRDGLGRHITRDLDSPIPQEYLRNASD